MKSRKITLLTITALLLIVGALFAPGILASGTATSKGDVVVFRKADISTTGGVPADNQGTVIKGASMKLTRTADGVSMELITKELPEGTYSIWWAIDNDGDENSGDDIDTAVGLEGIEVVRRATGGVVGANGVGKFAATLPAAPFPPGNGVTVAFNVATGDFDPMDARIGIVIRFHGTVISGAVDEQTNLFPGGCTNTPLVGAPGALTAGEGGQVCWDPQVTEFHSP